MVGCVCKRMAAFHLMKVIRLVYLTCSIPHDMRLGDGPET